MPVEAVARNEVVVGPLFDDVSVVENDDLVRVGDGPQAMCDDDHRLARAEGSDCSLDERFVLRVERSRGFVKEDHGGVFQEGARWRGAGAPLRTERRRSRNASLAMQCRLLDGDGVAYISGFDAAQRGARA